MHVIMHEMVIMRESLQAIGCNALRRSAHAVKLASEYSIMNEVSTHEKMQVTACTESESKAS